MKAVTQGITRSTELGLKNDMFKVSKPKLDEGEMAACFLKLKEIVPTVPHGKKISKTQLLQHVIDYICDLEVTLQAPVVITTANREPLSEKSEPNNIVTEVILRFVNIWIFFMCFFFFYFTLNLFVFKLSSRYIIS